MNKKFIEEQKAILLNERQKILNSDIMKSSDDLKIQSEDLPDEADLATSVINQQITFSIRHKEMQKLKAIDLALDRIEGQSYGSCDDCGEFIGEKRLQKRPYATLCIVHQEESERNQRVARYA